MGSSWMYVYPSIYYLLKYLRKLALCIIWYISKPQSSQFKRLQDVSLTLSQSPKKIFTWTVQQKEISLGSVTEVKIVPDSAIVKIALFVRVQKRWSKPFTEMNI